MQVRVVRETSASLGEYASIPIAFEVSEILDPSLLVATRNATDFRTIPIGPARIKDYDRYDGQSPLDWPSRFGVENWGILAAFVDNQRAGGAVVVLRDATIDTLEERNDLAVLWDLRVAPSFRRRGVGSALVSAAERWALDRGASELKVETQNTNVDACRFYDARGFRLGSVNPAAYPEIPDEVQLLWYKALYT
ncbi:MAG TPA: GNAT family N-acetyltransferase [Gemmatimonadaceae bacterium]|nr:GNAT family N-acetyltransferase [Gemmatimonadaceae bacterium]